MVRTCLICKNNKYSNPNISLHSFPANVEERKIWFSVLDFSEDRVLPKRAELCSLHFTPNDFEYRKSGVKYLKKGAVPAALLDSLSIDQLSDSTSDSTSNKHSFSDNEKESESFISSPFNKRIKLLPKPGCSKSTLSTKDSVPETSVISVPVSNFEMAQEPLSPSVSSTTESTLDGMDLTLSTISAWEREDQQNTNEISSQDKQSTKSMVKTVNKRPPHYLGDMTSSDFSSPNRGTKNFHILKNIIKRQRTVTRSLQQCVRRLKNKIISLETLIDELVKQKEISF